MELLHSQVVMFFRSAGEEEIRQEHSHKRDDCDLITRRVERVQQILRGRGSLNLAEVATGVGFSDQSKLCFHFKKIVGVTPGRFPASAKST
jgi:AraC-like DNA-binding protein